MDPLSRMTVQNALDKLEERLHVLERAVAACSEHVEKVTVENQKLRLDAHNLQEENKRLQGLVKRTSQLQSRMEIARSKLRELIKRISEAA